MNSRGGKSLSNSLPCKSSRTFRLWLSLTVGFQITGRNSISEGMNATSVVLENDNDDYNNNNVSYPIPTTDSEYTNFLSTSTTSWIPRTRFPVNFAKAISRDDSIPSTTKATAISKPKR